MAIDDEVINDYQGADRTKDLIDSVIRGKYNLRNHFAGLRLNNFNLYERFP